jgi:hypothetical protein
MADTAPDPDWNYGSHRFTLKLAHQTTRAPSPLKHRSAKRSGQGRRSVPKLTLLMPVYVSVTLKGTRRFHEAQHDHIAMILLSAVQDNMVRGLGKSPPLPSVVRGVTLPARDVLRSFAFCVPCSILRSDDSLDHGATCW